LSAVLLSSCAHETPGIRPGAKELSLFVASDLHLYSETLLSPANQRYIKENFSSDGRIQEHDYALVRALAEEVNEEAPDFLILTGDLSFNGEEDSHRELAKLLGGIENTKVLVIPGNHDVSSLTAFSGRDDQSASIPGIDAQTFREIYADFGYSGAYSYDENSLSYIYELGENHWAVMLDTSQSEYNEEMGFNIVGGFLEESTMNWLEEHLKYAQENGISVVSFSHHNLLVHNELFKSNYTLYNYEALSELYSKYGVRLNFSGHLHIQSIKSVTVNEAELHDISSGSLLTYSNRCGKLEIYDNCYSYASSPLADRIEGLREESFQVFSGKYSAKTAKQYREALGEEQGDAAARLLGEINAHYFDGSYTQIHALLEANRDLEEAIKANTPNFDTSYVKSIMDVPKEDQHTLLIER